MSLYVLAEKEYIASSWCRSILDGLNFEKKRKKIKLISVNSADELTAESEKNKSSVILIGTKSCWINENVNKVLDLNLNPILISNTELILDFSSCSIVSSDISGALNEAVLLSKEKGNDSIALYGVNPDSVSDNMRKNVFLALGGKKNDIYYNNGILENCFLNFSKARKKYSAIICVNDFSAISLINRLKMNNLYNEKTFIISLNSSQLGKCFSPEIISFSINYKKFGAAAFLIHEELTKNEYITSLNALIKYDLNYSGYSKKSKEKTINSKFFFNQTDEEVNIYADDEMIEMMSIERFLINADESDMLMLKMLNNKESYGKIEEVTYLSTSTIKYRIKNICKIFDVEHISDVLDILKQYIKL